MKIVFEIVSTFILVILITLICCFLFIKSNVPEFDEIGEFNYVVNNKSNIESVIARMVTLLGESCYMIDVNRGYDILNALSLDKKTKMTCTDSDMYLEFYFNNGKYKSFLFECGNFVYNGQKYKVKDEVVLYNKDVFVPDKIERGMIIVSDYNKVECR